MKKCLQYHPMGGNIQSRNDKAHTKGVQTMKVTITAESTTARNEKLEGVYYELVSIKEIHRRNGAVVKQVRVENGKRHIVFSNGVYQTITVQDEDTGRYIFKYSE